MVLYLNGTSAKGLSVDSENTLWAGTNRGVVRAKNGNWRYLPMPAGIHLQNVTVVAEDHENGVWLFDARKGLYRWAEGRMTDFSNEPLLKGKSILTSRADGRGTVWFGLNEGGVVVFDETRFHLYSESDGLAGGSVNTVHIDDNATVWIGTDRGLSRFDGRRFVTWNTSNGLPGERVLWILSDSEGRIWLGYSTGVACVGTRIETTAALTDQSSCSGACGKRKRSSTNWKTWPAAMTSRRARCAASDTKLRERTKDNMLEYIEINGTNLISSRIALGTWAIGGWMWGGTDEKESLRTIHAAFDHGINLIDTAPIYGNGRSEAIVGEALHQHGRRDSVILATKVGIDWTNGKSERNSSRQRILKELEDSLRRLQTDLHRYLPGALA